MDKSWVPTVVFLVASVGVVALLTRIVIWLVYCFKAAPHRSGAEEMEIAERARDLQEGKSFYTSYEQWRADVLSDKPIGEIIGRVPPGFFDKKPEPPMGAQGPQGAVVTVNYEIKGSLGPKGEVGPQGPQGAQASLVARQRLEEIKRRMGMEEDKSVKMRLEEIRQKMIVQQSAMQHAPYYPIANTIKPYCQNCKGTGYVTVPNINGIPTSGVRCSHCWRP